MHDTAYAIGGAFIRDYSANRSCRIVEIGSMNVNGTLRDHVEAKDTYLGLDVEHGDSVDLVVDPLKPLPLRSGFADIVLSSSQMEHDKFFWQTFLELVRIAKDGGYIYISAPSNGDYHSFPIDCWRFYPEAGLALAEWANANGLPCTLIESFTGRRKADAWNDYVAIFQKSPPDRAAPVSFMSDRFASYNVRKFGVGAIGNLTAKTEDQDIIADAQQRARALQDEVDALAARVRALELELAAARSVHVAEPAA